MKITLIYNDFKKDVNIDLFKKIGFLQENILNFCSLIIYNIEKTDIIFENNDIFTFGSDSMLFDNYFSDFLTNRLENYKKIHNNESEKKNIIKNKICSIADNIYFDEYSKNNDDINKNKIDDNIKIESFLKIKNIIIYDRKRDNYGNVIKNNYIIDLYTKWYQIYENENYINYLNNYNSNIQRFSFNSFFENILRIPININNRTNIINNNYEDNNLDGEDNNLDGEDNNLDSEDNNFDGEDNNFDDEDIIDDNNDKINYNSNNIINNDINDKICNNYENIFLITDVNEINDNINNDINYFLNKYCINEDNEDNEDNLNCYINEDNEDNEDNLNCYINDDDDHKDYINNDDNINLNNSLIHNKLIDNLNDSSIEQINLELPNENLENEDENLENDNLFNHDINRFINIFDNFINNSNNINNLNNSYFNILNQNLNIINLLDQLNVETINENNNSENLVPIIALDDIYIPSNIYYTQTINLNENTNEDVIVALSDEEFEKNKSDKYCEFISENKCIECLICIEKFNKDDIVTQIKCKHIFHKDCIKSWLCKQSYKCPICRIEAGNGIPINI